MFWWSVKYLHFFYKEENTNGKFTVATCMWKLGLIHYKQISAPDANIPFCGWLHSLLGITGVATAELLC